MQFSSQPKVMMGLTLSLIICALGSLMVGAYPLSFAELGKIMGSFFTGQGTDQATYLIFHIRLPRIILAITTGAGLAITGAAIQGLFRNPLADPTLIGVSSGAVLFAVLAIVLLSSVLAPLVPWLQQATVTVAAFIGSIITTFLVYRIAKNRQTVSVVTMLLAGIAISALASAVVGFMLFISDDQQLRDITFWTLGSLSGASWLSVLSAAPLVALGTILLCRQAREINALLLGEKEAAYLGVEVERIKTLVIIISALIVGVCISLTGIIGFVGLVIPHFLRLIFGGNYRSLLPYSALAGAIFLLATDSLARTIVAPAELPLGIITAIIGAPFFLWLIYRSQKNSAVL